MRRLRRSSSRPELVWRDEDLDQLKRVPGSAFEAVRTGPILRRG